MANEKTTESFSITSSVATKSVLGMGSLRGWKNPKVLRTLLQSRHRRCNIMISYTMYLYN